MTLTPTSSLRPRDASPRVPGFTLIEVITVVGIIVILVGLTIPAIKSLTKSNDQSQATNLIRSMIAAARSVAISQHRMAGVVFFDETPTFSRPAHANVTAMQLFVEDYDQSSGGVAQGIARFVYYSTTRQYLPVGTRLATLSDNLNGLTTSESAATIGNARAVLFDANGTLITRDGLAAPVAGNGTPGTYPAAYGDWQFLEPGGFVKGNDGVTVSHAYSSPGFFLYNRADLDAQNFNNDAFRAGWIHKNASVIIINPNTGGVLR